MAKVKNETVKLKSKDGKQKQTFSINQAIKILSLKNSKWELDDDKFEIKDGDLIKK